MPATGDGTIAPAGHRGINWMVRASSAATTQRFGFKRPQDAVQ